MRSNFEEMYHDTQRDIDERKRKSEKSKHDLKIALFFLWLYTCHLLKVRLQEHIMPDVL